MADEIRSGIGNNARGVASGKNIDQDSVGQNTYVTVETDRPLNEIALLNERLDRLEVARNETQRTLSRIVSLMDGDPGYRIVGLPDQISAYIKANEDWKKATEQRVVTAEERLSRLESNNQIVITPQTAFGIIVVGALCLVLAFLFLSWLQSKKPLPDISGAFTLIIVPARQGLYHDITRHRTDGLLFFGFRCDATEGFSLLS